MRTRALLALSLAWGGPAFAATLDVGDELILSDDQVPDFGAAAKVKVKRLGNGKLVAVFADGAGPLVYDTKADAERPARDIFARTCNANSVDCSLISSWSPPVNLSNGAGSSTIASAWRGPAAGTLPYAGDVDKPNLFSVSSDLVVSWVSKYCPGGAQRTVTYLERDEREIPFSCAWVAHSADGGSTWQPAQQLSDGWRDAKQDVNQGSTAAWAVTWQEDPQGLQLGEADGPGDGASGAKVSKGTDIWYAGISFADLHAGQPFPAPVRLTNNFTKLENRQGTTDEVEDGQEGASRANLSVVGDTVILAYEETKGSEGLDEGKYIRYHAFRWNQPPTSCETEPVSPGDTDADTDLDTDAGFACRVNSRGEAYPAEADPARVGCILSDPDENARRVRFFSQDTPGTNTGLRMHIFWKQGLYDQGGPSDIVARSGFVAPGDPSDAAGFQLTDFEPALNVPTALVLGDVLDGCYVAGDAVAGTGAAGNLPGWNLSHDTEGTPDLAAITDANANEDARAHRGFLRSDFIALGYSYTPDWAVARFTDLENYEFWIRTSNNGGRAWSAPKDVTSATTAAMATSMGLLPNQINVKEPRIVRTPGNGPGCPSGDPQAPNTTRGSDCTSGTTFIVAWGTETNVYEHLGGAQDLDLWVTRTTNKGASYETPVRMAVAADLADAELESQIQVTPDGKTLYLTWNEERQGVADSAFAIGQVIDGEICNGIDDDGDGLVDADDPDVPDLDGDGFNACLDCDDGDFLVFPGSFEVVGDEIDQDCDGVEICYVDDDEDGARGRTTRVSLDAQCQDPWLAVASDPLDCWDGDPTYSQSDVDGDGLSTCEADCDDGDAGVQACPGQAWLRGADPMVAGSSAVFQISGAASDASLALVVGLPGGSTALPGCPGVTVPFRAGSVVRAVRTAVDGTAAFALSVPPALRGRTYAFVAASPARCEVSNVLVRTID